MNSLFEPNEEEQFLLEIRERLAYIAKKRIHSEDYEEVVQNAMVEIRSRLNEVQQRTELMPFVFQMLRNCIRDYYQKKKREEKVLEFSPDSRYYYQAELNNELWREIIHKGIEQLEREDSRSAEFLTKVLAVTKNEDLEQKFDMDRLNFCRILYRCREALFKTISDDQKIPLP
jgi:DNA-directed RNA polymerase specialized sigma24 family protein